MKIGNNSTGPLVDKTGTSRTGEARTDRAASTASTSASINLSELSSQMHALETGLAKGAEFDRARVDSIKSAIQRGEFTVNAGAVADSMIASARESLATRS